MSAEASSGGKPRARLALANRQRVRRVDRRLLRRITLSLLREQLGCNAFDLAFCLVGAKEMTRVNETYLHHAGSTDVITFDYNDVSEPEWLRGEIFICLDECVAQAARFRTTWQSELVRYIVHGVLHLSGYDDLKPPARIRMKRKENLLLKRLAAEFAFGQIG